MSNTGRPVRGLRPIFASVAAIIARSRQVTRIAALSEVDVEGPFRLLVHQAEVEQQMCDGAVAVPGPPLRLEHRLVGRQWATGGGADASENVIESRLAVARMKQRGHRNRTGVDHRVVRSIRSGLQLDGVEGVSARLDADLLRDFVMAVLFDRHPKGERLRN